MAKNWWEDDPVSEDKEENWWSSDPVANDDKGGRIDLPADIAPSAGRSATPMGRADPRIVDNRGIIQRVGDFLKPDPESVLQNYQPTPEERQAEINRRLSYGAGPISSKTAATADLVRSGMAKTDSQTVKKVAKAMEEQGTKSIGDLIEAAKNPVNGRAARDAKAEEFRAPGEWAVDTLSNLGQGAVGLVQLPINIIAPSSSIANTLRETQKELQAQESDVLKAQREQLRERVLNEDGFLDKYAATVVQMVTNPALGISEAAKQVPNFLGIVGASRLVGAASAGAVGLVGRASPTLALGEAISGGAIQSAARVAGTTAGGVGASMAMAGGDAAGGVYEKLTSNDPEVLAGWRKNVDYQRLLADKIESGMDRKDASRQAIEELATAKARMAALVTAPLGLLGFAGAESAVASRGLGRATAEALTASGAGKLLVKDILGEQLEEGGTQFGGNVVSRTVDPNQSLTEGVPEAMGTALVTSAPFAAAGARSQYKEAMQGKEERTFAGRIADVLIGQEQNDPRLTSPMDTVRAEKQVGPNAPVRTALVMNFTEPDSATARAGLTPIVVPVPEGGTDVSTIGRAGAATQVGGVDGRDQRGQGLATAGSDLVRAGKLGGADTAGVPAAAGADLVAGGAAAQRQAGVGLPRPLPRATDADLLSRTEAAVAAQENNNAVVQPTEQWFGRKGDGYLTETDAQQALPGRQRMFKELDWKIEQMPNGKYRLAGYAQNVQVQTEASPDAATGRGLSGAGSSAAALETTGLNTPTQETTLGTQATQAIQGQTQGQEATTAVAPGSGPVAATGATGAPAQLQGGRVPGLSPAPTAPIREFGKFQRAVAADGIEIAPLRAAEMNTQHQVASAVARVLGKTYTVARVTSGDPLALSNGMIDKLGGKHIVAAENSDDAPLFVAIHEAYHGLPEQQRKQLNTQLLQLFRSENKARFLKEFNYSEDRFDEEAPAFMAQVISKRADFWEELRTKMGNREFADVARLVLGTLNQIVRKVTKQYGQDFADTYITDVVKARDLLTTAYAEAMQAQGLTPDVETEAGVMASQRSAGAMEMTGDLFKSQTDAERRNGFAIKLNNPVTLADGSRLSGFTDPVGKTTFYGYDKNGERFTIRREFVKAEDVVSSRDGNRTADAVRATLGRQADAGAGTESQAGSREIRPGSRGDVQERSGSERAGDPVSKDEAVVDGVVYSSKRRNLVDIPTIELKDLVGKKVVGIKADLTDAGRSYTGIDGSQLEFPVEMMGGPNYVRLPENAKANVVWAVRGGATLTKIMSQVEKSDYVLVHAMNGNSHLTNSTISTAYLQTVEAYLRDGRISRENLAALDEIVRSPKNKSGLPDFPGFESPEIYSYIDSLSFDQRGALAQILEKKEAQVHGLPNLERFRRETIDPDFAGYRQGDAMLVIKVDKENPTVKLGENGTKLHPSYPLGLRGTVIGKLAKGVNYELIFRDYFKFAVPNFKNGEAGAWYAFDRKMPIQKITKEIAESVAPGNYTSITSARHARASLEMANNNWLVSGKTKAQGGVSVQEFVDALQANEGAAALTLYSAEEVKAGIKAKTFTVYQLGKEGGDKGLQIFFGLKRGAPWYKDMIEGVGEDEVEVVSVTNNENGAPGVGIPAIITKAIFEGATLLDAFAVKSARFPKGFLPEMYAEFGFEEIGRIPFDPSYYDANGLADLKAFWSRGGWKESDGFPDVVVMRWKGNDEDRATAIDRYVRSGATGVPGQGVADVRGAAAESREQRNGPRAEKGRAGRVDSGQARGNQGAGNAASVVTRAYNSIQELARLSDGDIRNLGLDPTEVERLRNELAGVQRSNRSAELARGPGARSNEGAGQTVTGIHYGRVAGLSRLSGTSFGTGIKGAEQARLNEPGVDPRIKKRVYFYLTTSNTDMPRPEIGLGSHVYRASLGNMFDMSTATAADKARVQSLRKTGDANGFESAILDAGYRGYVNREMQTIVVLNADVPVAYEGMANAGRMRDRIAERTVQGPVTRTEGDELVRKPTNDEMLGIIKARPALATAAPSFKLQFGDARVNKAEAEAADRALAEAGASFQFGEVMRSNRATSLEEDLKRQQLFLQERAQSAGFADIEEFVANNYDGFVAAAKEWRSENEIMFSNRVTPADRIKWRKISDVRQEIGLDALPRHIIPFANFMRTMSEKAANGDLTARDLVKAYTIARSSMNRTAVTTDRVRQAGLVLPANFSDAKIRPEGAFGYWLLSDVGQRYLNAAERQEVDADAIADAVKVMAPFGTQNALGKDLERAASGDLHRRLPAMAAAIVKAASGKNAVKDWQDATDNLYGVREAKKGFFGSLLGFGQLPTFDARQININVVSESKEDTLRALSSTKARDVVAKLSRRMDALSLTMDPQYAPFYRHLVHHAVWDAVGKTETTHEDVMESMVMASNRARQTETPEFKRWFGDSKIVDAEGRPLVVYHGTGADITAFAPEKSADGVFHFAIDTAMANRFAVSRASDGVRGANVMPVYLAIKNPKRVAFISTIEIEAAKAEGHDGLIAENRGHLVAFEPEQIKSATGNVGTYGQRPVPAEEAAAVGMSEVEANEAQKRGDIRFSRRQSLKRQKLLGASFEMDASDKVDAARIKLQDDALRMKRVIEAVKAKGGKVGEAQNFYDANTLMPGRIQAAIDDFKNDVVKPMLDKAAKYDIDLDELALYAYAKHAKERNAYIASINQRFPDGGSGMTNADADKILADVRAGGKQREYEDLHKDLMAITSTTRQVMLNEGLITQDEFDAMDGAYQNYIPLRGFENVDEETGAIRPGLGRGVNVRGKETIRALGRASRAGDLIENALRDYERVVARAEKNDVGKVLLDFVLSNPDPDLWGVDVERNKAAFNKALGTVQYTKTIEKGEDTIGIKVGGEQVYIKFADKELARALRQAWKDETSGLERATLAMTGWWNNWMRAVLTKYNPAFAAINIPRDALWSGTAAALDELGAKGLGLYLKNYGKALMASSRQELGVSGSTNPVFGNPQVDRMFQEFRAAGGITGGFYMRSLNDINQELRNELLLAGASARNPWEAIKSLPPFKLAKLTLKTLEFMGSASENATRFALYMTSREMGKTPTKAALLAKNGTTNFNRKGEWGGALNNLYLFFNAAVQGNAQLIKVLKNRKVQAAMAGVSGVGMMLALYGATAGGEDDDGEKYWDKIPSYIKERNLVIMLPPGEPLVDGIDRVGKRGRYITIPVQYGFNIFPNLGYMMADVLRNAEDKRRGVTPTKAALHMTSVVMGSINPFGGAVDLSDGIQVLLAVSPTLTDLPIQLVNERGTFGSPSAPPKSPWDKRPDSERMYVSQQDTVPARIAKAINELGGGNEAKAGSIMGMETSVTPGTIQTLISATTGGLGSFVEQVGSSVIAMSGDEKDLKANKVPFLNKFYGEVDESANIRSAAERMAQIRKLSDEVKAQQKIGIDPGLKDDEQKLLALAGMQETYQKQQAQMRKAELEIIKDAKMTDAQKTLERRRLQVERDKLATEVNRAYLQATK